MNTGWLIPDWPAPAGVEAVFTTRAGGVSAAPWGSLNLGDHVGDMPVHVSANRALLSQAIDARPVFLRQVHGTEVAHLTSCTEDGTEADACLTEVAGLACTIMVADCLPVLLTTADGAVIAAAHAGWRGLAGVGGVGVLESTVGRLRAVAGELSKKAPEVLAWLGPCIGPAAFEVGAEVKAAFEAADPAAAACFVAQSPSDGAGEAGSAKYLADLPALARLRLAALGVNRVYGNDGSAPWCTVGNPSEFFSHRRDAGRCAGANGSGTTGRMAAAIWRV
ncbi:peptidoglycan editing factor PgeF [Polaromonas sp. YR568]|uniref:peptidoglycan editing factor PgeF n=1 Tax=Polaromonas sp. YR568 TaxID=1855301 RepID=UPI003137AE4A